MAVPSPGPIGLQTNRNGRNVSARRSVGGAGVVTAATPGGENYALVTRSAGCRRAAYPPTRRAAAARRLSPAHLRASDLWLSFVNSKPLRDLLPNPIYALHGRSSRQPRPDGLLFTSGPPAPTPRGRPAKGHSQLGPLLELITHVFLAYLASAEAAGVSKRVFDDSLSLLFAKGRWLKCVTSGTYGRR
ncbi:hypothetical protein EVAR_68115_1 [Eumeta japonica]|uniref:Uncharacterized protein n=1 Tax=Eumeta variegata TaxID=151549 RepID=A0A4C1ZEM5_EUMVA|nr:hypothetical protein EVAR_68115_1 [Eumeta japonica]